MDAPATHKDATDHLLKSASFSIDDWPAFVVGIEQAAELFGRMLGKIVQGEFLVEIREIVSGPAGELIDENRPHVTNVLRAHNWEATLLAGTSRASVFTIVEMLFGGDGAVDGFAGDRDCTNVELAAAELVFRHLAAVLQSSFAPIADPGMTPGICAGEVMLEDMGGPAEPIVMVRFSCQMLEQSFEIYFAVAQQTLLTIGEDLQVTPEDPVEESDPKWSQHFDRQFRRADVHLTAIMNGGELTLDDVSRLRPGQVLELESTSDSLIKVESSGQTVLWCRLGQTDGSFVLRVEDFANAEQDLMDELLTANAARR